MDWDRDYVREKYGFSMFGFDGIYYPSPNAKRLVVFFSSMGKDRFDRYSWFWEQDEVWNYTAYLFLKDDSFHYFQGDDTKPLRESIKRIINHHMLLASVDNQSVYMVGNSMGGYAAIFFAFYLNAKAAIVSNPQVNFRSSQMHHFLNWERHIREVGTQWYDLDLFVRKYISKPHVYIEFGNYMADKCAGKDLVQALMEEECLVVVRRTNWTGHTVDALLKSTIENAIHFFEMEPTLLVLKPKD